MFSLEFLTRIASSRYRGDSTGNSQYTIFNLKQSKSPLIIQNLQQGDFFKGLKNEFETSIINEPSVFEPLKFYCTCILAENVVLAIILFHRTCC